MIALRSVASLFACIFLLATAGCASTPKPVDVKLTIAASEDANPDGRKRPSPVVVRLFELKSLTAFNNADFFSLWERDRETLGNELVAREEYTLRPGDTLDLVRKVQAETLYLGAVAAFRDLEHAQWRAVSDQPPRKAKTITIRASGKALTVEAK
jgi:type VI secretion system protein VasD